MSIRNRLLLAFLAMPVLGMSLLAAYVFVSFRGYVVDTELADLRARAIAIGESVTDWLERSDVDRVGLVVRRYGAQQGIRLRVFDPAGALVASSQPEVDRQNDRRLRTLPGVLDALRGRSAGGVAHSLQSSEQRLYQAVPLQRAGRDHGVLYLSRSLAEMHAHVVRAGAVVAGALLLAIAVCIVVSMRLARGLARPIQEMADFTRRLGGGHLGERLGSARQDELGQLAQALDRMSARLGRLDDERRAFLANVSHELRTPVSNVQVTLEALASGADQDPERRRRFIQTALDETARLARLIGDLLDLGRLEAGVVALDRQPCSLRALVERAVCALEPRARASDVELRADVPDVTVDADPERVLQAFLAVLDNALKFGPPGTTIAIAGRADGDRAVLTVRDQGPGISEADRSRVFEQFYTRDPSRSSGGAGLGLAVARRIVVAHGGAIFAGGREGEGAELTIALPSAKTPRD